MDGRKASPTSKDTQLQRRGRVGRNKDGYSYEPACEGLGRIPIPYGAPVSFAEKCVAEYCEVPQLLEFPNYSTKRKAVIGISALDSEQEQALVESPPTVGRIPYFRILEGNDEEKNGQAILVTLWLAGVEANDFMKTWDSYVVNKHPLGEEYDHVTPILDRMIYKPVCVFQRALDLVSRNGVAYLVGDPKEPMLIKSSFIRPVEHRWVTEAETKRTSYSTGPKGEGKKSALVEEMQAQIEDLQKQILEETGDLLLLPDMKSTEAKLRQEQMDVLRKTFLRHFCACGLQKNPTFSYCSVCTKRAVGDRKTARNPQHLMKMIHGHALGGPKRLRI